ncbi:glycosyltransferase family 4 protein [Lachnospiraceae bacterium KK002]
MKKMLMVASVPSMIGQFNMDNISVLQKLGYKVYVACDFKDRSVWDEERTSKFKGELCKKGIRYDQIDFSRSPFNIKKNIAAYKQMYSLVRKERFALVHCHTPVASAIARVVAHKLHVKIIYTAHGFHFYHGAPWKNWAFFYPVEKILSQWTDVLITINKEDYRRAKKDFYAKKVVYVPGVGVDTDKFHSFLINAAEKRAELGITDTDIMLLSVGELSQRKNHEVVIRAIRKVNNPSIKYFICGKGESDAYLTSLIKESGLKSQVKLLGYRTDISELCQAADLFVFPSHQEGLPVALMEAIACQTPVLCSNIRGNTDLVKDKMCLFDENNLEDLVQHLEEIIRGGQPRITMKESVMRNYDHLKSFDLKSISDKMTALYEWGGGKTPDNAAGIKKRTGY